MRWALSVLWLFSLPGILGSAPPAPRSQKEGTSADGARSTGAVEYFEGLSEETLRNLEHWLRRAPTTEGRRSVARDLFREDGVPAPPSRPAPTAEAPEAGVDLPSLKGFVYEAGGPVAAIRFRGRMWLVRVGDSLSTYRVDKMTAGEEVQLVDEGTGELLLLKLN